MIKHNAIAEVNLKNLAYNYKTLSDLANQSICAATIKANAYGIGVIKTFEILYKNNCRHFFVATTEEALEIREKKLSANLYILNGLENNKLSIFNDNNIIPILNDKDEYNLICKNIKKYKKLKFGIHVDTGLNRLGLSLNELLNINFNQMKVHILISHLSSADEYKNKYNKVQNKKFKQAINHMINAKFNSFSNSMGLILGENYHYDLVRPGISLYGGHFNTKMKKIIKPVISLKGKVLQIKEISKNEFVGYNQTYKTNKKIKVAVLGIGYADGISRLLSNKGNVYFKNQTFGIVGRVSMDTITIDITKSSKSIKVGEYMEFINHLHGIDKMAKQCNTICDEILTSISDRVKRIYI
ncbi:alanine racemase [Alphaproteobacteria bacterium]|nr:alanine racemase [Alphaproteobacteria bacterium]